MVQKTKLTVKQGATYMIPFTADDGPGTDYTGWSVIFMVKKTLATANVDALINATCALDPVSGSGQVAFADETTALWPVGEYVYGAVLKDAAGNVAKTDNGIFVVENTTYQGAVA